MSRLSLPTVFSCLAIVGVAFPLASRAQELTQTQIESIRAQLTELKEGADKRFSSRTSSAGDVFLAASSDAKKALDLYFKCHKLVNYDQEGRSESDFRAWRDDQEQLENNDRFLEGLRVQLLYLGISCKAAEAETVDAVIPRLMSYVDGLSNLKELPGPPVLGSVNGSIFVEAYKLQDLLSNNESWETTPFNIGGIYEKTILPFLREEKPTTLMNAWDKRIEQETRVAAFINQMQKKEQEGDRDEKREVEDRQKNFERSKGGQIFKAYDEDDFVRDTLPNLKWAKLKDQYLYVGQVTGAQTMLAFLNENAASEHLKTWVGEMEALLAESASPGNAADAFVPEEPLPPTPDGRPPGLE